ncbi:hypothetical protein J7E95_39165, partial [Streptomyces sp. ISL-14]|nr:hypothetical protein [Streptomyces sp. ISL-14]
MGQAVPGDHVLRDQPLLIIEAEPEVVDGDGEFTARAVVAAVAVLRGGMGACSTGSSRAVCSGRV